MLNVITAVAHPLCPLAQLLTPSSHSVPSLHRHTPPPHSILTLSPLVPSSHSVPSIHSLSIPASHWLLPLLSPLTLLLAIMFTVLQVQADCSGCFIVTEFLAVSAHLYSPDHDFFAPPLPLLSIQQEICHSLPHLYQFCRSLPYASHCRYG